MSIPHLSSALVWPCDRVPTPETPYVVLGIDHLPPFPLTPDGNQYIIVVIDHVTKWVELRAVPTTAVDNVIKFIRENVILCHGFPRVILLTVAQLSHHVGSSQK